MNGKWKDCHDRAVRLASLVVNVGERDHHLMYINDVHYKVFIDHLTELYYTIETNDCFKERTEKERIKLVNSDFLSGDMGKYL